MKLGFLICLLFSVIRRYFFNAYSRCLKFVRSLTTRHDGRKRGVRHLPEKILPTNGSCGDFFRQMQKNTPSRRVNQFRANKL